MPCPVQSLVVYDRVSLAVQYEESDPSLMTMPSTWDGQIAKEDNPLCKRDLLELRHDVELADALPALHDRNVSGADDGLAKVNPIVETPPTLEKLLVVARWDRSRA